MKIGQDIDAYLAGIFDGEGHISFARNPDRKWSVYVTLGVTNTHLPTLQLLKRCYGGYITSRKVKDGYKPCWVWRANGKDAYWALSRMLPWIRIKIAKARAAIVVIRNHPINSAISHHQKCAISKAIAKFHVVRHV